MKEIAWRQVGTLDRAIEGPNPQMRAGSPRAHVTCVKDFGEAVENITLPVTFFRMTGLGVGQ